MNTEYTTNNEHYDEDPDREYRIIGLEYLADGRHEQLSTIKDIFNNIDDKNKTERLNKAVQYSCYSEEATRSIRALDGYPRLKPRAQIVNDHFANIWATVAESIQGEKNYEYITELVIIARRNFANTELNGLGIAEKTEMLNEVINLTNEVLGKLQGLPNKNSYSLTLAGTLKLKAQAMFDLNKLNPKEDGGKNIVATLNEAEYTLNQPTVDIGLGDCQQSLRNCIAYFKDYYSRRLGY